MVPLTSVNRAVEINEMLQTNILRGETNKRINKAHGRKDRKKVKWTLEMNVKLLELDEKGRNEGPGLVNRLKKLWERVIFYNFIRRPTDIESPLSGLQLDVPFCPLSH